MNRYFIYLFGFILGVVSCGKRHDEKENPSNSRDEIILKRGQDKVPHAESIPPADLSIKRVCNIGDGKAGYGELGMLGSRDPRDRDACIDGFFEINEKLIGDLHSKTRLDVVTRLEKEIESLVPPKNEKLYRNWNDYLICVSVLGACLGSEMALVKLRENTDMISIVKALGHLEDCDAQSRKRILSLTGRNLKHP